MKQWFNTPDPEIAHMSLGMHWVLRIIALATIGLLVYLGR